MKQGPLVQWNSGIDRLQFYFTSLSLSVNFSKQFDLPDFDFIISQ